MALIPNFPQNLLDIHHHWHDPSVHMGSPGRMHPFGTTGAGLEFLQFHRDYMAQFHAWYDNQPFGTAPFDTAPFNTAPSAISAVAGWTAVPAVLKNAAITNWGGVQMGQEARLTSLTPPFNSDDDLGTYIEGGIHGWIHGATAAAFGEPIVGSFHSPQSTYFYGIHGLVDYWWRQWQKSRKRWVKEFVKEHKEFVKEHKELIFEKPQPDKNFKEIFEGGGFPGHGGDPITLASTEVGNPGMPGSDPLIMDVHQRLRDLETKFSQQAFITPSERPAVGEAAHLQEKQRQANKPPRKDNA